MTTAKDKQLTPEQERVLRQGGTEVPFSGRYHNAKEAGVYGCVGCGQQLFSSDTKFDSGTGWPSFDEALQGAVAFREDTSGGMRRTEVVCSKCGGHLGHVFDDPGTIAQLRTGQVARQDGKLATKRYCINSVCLNLRHDEK